MRGGPKKRRGRLDLARTLAELPIRKVAPSSSLTGGSSGFKRRPSCDDRASTEKQAARVKMGPSAHTPWRCGIDEQQCQIKRMER
eukprot:1186350-Pleurochrysis_carterae.AAC.1